MATRTTKIASIKPAASVNTNVLTVAAGYTWILKSVVVFNNAGVADTVYAVPSDAAGNPANIIYGVVVAAGARVEWNGWLVLVPTDQVAVLSVNGTSIFWLSGTKLAGVA